MAFGLGGLLGGGPVPDVQMPDGLPVSGGKGSPLVDAYLALQAQRLQDAFTAPQRALNGDLQIWDPATGHTTDEAQGAAAGMAGLAMTGSMPFKAPAGAIRSFGGGQSLDDLLSSMSATIDQHAASVAPDVRPMNRVDPKAASWDLYHGTDAPTDFARFDTNLPKAQRGHTPSSETGGVFLSPAPDEAAQYSGSIGGRTGAEAGPRVIRTTVDPGRTDVFDLPHLMENDPAFVARARQTVIDENGGAARAGRMFDERHARMLDEFQSARDLNRQLTEMGYPATEVPQVQWGYGATGAAMQMARERGLDTAVLRGLSESNGGDQVVALTPGRVRSYYDPSHVLYSGGPAGAAAGLPALASSSDPKGSPVSAGPAPAVPSMLDGLSPEMVARLLQAAQAQPAPGGPSPVDSLLFDRSGMGAPDNAFSGSSGTVVGNKPQQVAQPPAPQTTGALPQPAPKPAPAPAPQEDDAPAAPAPRAVPLPPARPAEFTSLADAAAPPANSFDPLTGQPTSGTPKPVAPPAPVQTASADQGPGFLSVLSNPRVYNTLLGIGAGILQGRTFGEGLGQGIENAQRMNAQQGAVDLQQLKAQREQAAMGGNVAIYKRFFPNASPEEALAGSQNSTIMTELMKRGLPATETYRQETDDKGNQWQVNTANGQRSLLKSADEDKSVAPVSEADRQSLGLPPGVYQKDANGKISSVAQAAENKTVTQIPEAERVQLGLPAGAYQRDANGKISPINPTGTTINMGGEKAFDAEVGKAYAKQYTDLQSGDRNARNKLNTLALMEQAMNTPGFYSGIGGEGVKRANQFLGALGFKDAKAASGAEVMDALGNQIVLDQLGGSLGAGISDSDRKSIALIGPSIQKTPEGNRQLIGIYRSIAQREQQIAQMARDYAKANGGRIDAGFDDQVARFAEANPLFPAAQSSARAQSDGVAGAAPARAAIEDEMRRRGMMK